MARPRQVSDEDILQAVRDAVAEDGHGVSTSAIATRVGLSQAALFKRFGTKEALLIRGLAPTKALVALASLGSGPTGDRPFREQLTELASELHAMLRVVMPRIEALRSCGYDPSTIFEQYEVPPPIQLVRGLAQWFSIAREAGLVRADVDADSLAKVLVGSLFFESHLHKVAGKWLPEPDPEHHVEQVVAILCTGILVEGK